MAFRKTRVFSIIVQEIVIIAIASLSIPAVKLVSLASYV